MADRSALLIFARSTALAAAILSLTGMLSRPAAAQSGGGNPLSAQPFSPGVSGSPLSPMTPTTPMAPAQPQALGPNDPRNPLHLTADQQHKWQATQMKFQPQVRAIVQNNSLSANQKKARVEGLFKEAKAEFMSILTPAQRTQLQKMQQVASARQTKLLQLVKARQAQITKLAGQLQSSLSPAQKKKLDALQSEAKPVFEKLYNDKTLTPQQKNAKMQALGQTYMARRDQVLTPSQKVLLKKIQTLQTEPLSARAVQ